MKQLDESLKPFDTMADELLSLVSNAEAVEPVEDVPEIGTFLQQGARLKASALEIKAAKARLIEAMSVARGDSEIFQRLFVAAKRANARKREELSNG